MNTKVLLDAQKKHLHVHTHTPDKANNTDTGRPTHFPTHYKNPQVEICLRLKSPTPPRMGKPAAQTVKW